MKTLNNFSDQRINSLASSRAVIDDSILRLPCMFLAFCGTLNHDLCSVFAEGLTFIDRVGGALSAQRHYMCNFGMHDSGNNSMPEIPTCLFNKSSCRKRGRYLILVNLGKTRAEM